MSTPILATKLYIPPQRPKIVLRPRLIDQLNEGLHRKLTLISASAGFGKTTLLSEWVALCEQPAAWLSLDEEHNDPTRFLIYFVAALRTVIPEFGDGVLTALQSPQPPPPEAVLTTLLNEITAVSADSAKDISPNFFLILDDYHHIESQTVDQAVAFLLQHLPPSMHLVIATREDPPLPLARLRVRGQLTELRTHDLRFTQAEAAEFLNQAMGLNLSAEDIAALENRTEGWIAGLQLAALSMQGQEDASGFIQSFTGSHRFVLDYLVEEVLQQQTEEVQTFLLQTAVLDRFCAPLCDTVLGKDEGGRMKDEKNASSSFILDYLERANLFLIPLDNERRWYRYHHLFADLLRQRLQQQGDALITELHIRASKWYEAHDLEMEAFLHAAAAHDIPRAERLIAGKGMPLQFRGTAVPILNWLNSLPPATLNGSASLLVTYASTLLAIGQIIGIEEKIKAAEILLQDAELDEKNRDLIGRIASIRASVAVATHQADTIITQAQRALEYLHPDNQSVRTSITWSMGYAYELQGDRAAAGRAYAETLAAAQPMGHMIMAMMSTLGLAHIQEADNQLHQAAQTFQGLLQWIGDPPPLPICEAYLGLARIHYEWNDLETAQTFWEQNVPLAAQFGPKIDRIVISDVFHARLKLAQGEVNAAAAILAKAETAVHEQNFVQQLLRVTAVQVLVLLRQGDLDTAAQLAKKNDLPISQARVYLAQGETEQALTLLATERGQMEAKNWANELLKVMVLQALAYDADGDGETAVQQLSEALTLAQPNGFIRTFVDEGQPMMELLARMKARPEQGRRDEGGRIKDYIRKLLTAFGELDEIHPSSFIPSTSSGQAPQPLPEPLSEREIEVLQLVAQGFSNREISEQLFLALDTVKGHNRRIFGKLNVQNRTEAAARARELRVI